MYEIRGDTEDLRRLTKGIKAAEPALKRATVSAINKTATSSRTKAVKLVAGDYRVAQKAVRRELIIARATFKRMVARIVGEGSPGIPLYQFYPTPKRVPSTRRLMKGGYTPKGGIKVMVTRGRRKQVSGAFIARMRSGHVGVFRRSEDGRRGRTGRPVIEELFGPSPIRLLSQERYRVPLENHAVAEMGKNIGREAEFYLRKYKVIPNA